MIDSLNWVKIRLTLERVQSHFGTYHGNESTATKRRGIYFCKNAKGPSLSLHSASEAARTGR
ncbi:hypothetical protein NQ314_007230 [Rhamnusium bicolor]|uniref:Uncharacterized protein n=1 Tax=Rhamnusium bicolor TaxID=1586634 RepID=A0AAV8YSI9_9CUCU|nr:hypothetical protein NQ314_007230 [Rhamnusium bicolor]